MTPQCSVRRWVWAEDVPFSVLNDVALLRLLQRRRLGLVTSVRPGEHERLAPLLHATRENDVPLSLWPMLRDDAGRWLSASNTGRFIALYRDLMAVVDRAATSPVAMVFDLEPPIDDVRRMLRGRFTALGRPKTASTDLALRGLVARLRQRNIETWAAVVPTVLYDAPLRRGWQHLLGTPVDGLDFAWVSPMLYTSLLQGYSRGFIRRGDALAWLARSALRCRQRFGSRASVSLGAVGVGALGDEQLFASPAELATDVDIVLAAGIEHLALFDLGGVLARSPPEPWLDALCRPKPATMPIVPASWRSRGVEYLVHAVSHAAHATLKTR